MGELCLVGSSVLLLMVVQQLVVILMLLQEDMSAHPFAPPSPNSVHFCYWTNFIFTDAQWGQVNRNIGTRSRERIFAGSGKENGWLMLKTPELPVGLGGRVLIGKIRDEGCRMCGFLLIGWWWSNRAVFQESWAPIWIYHPPLGWEP